MKILTLVWLFAGIEAGLNAKPSQQAFQLPSNIDDLDVGDKIPGGSSFRHCTQVTQRKSILRISSLKLHPTPPDIYSGDFLYYTISGKLSSPVPQNSRVQFATWYDDHPGAAVWDFCDVMEPKGKACPPQKGEIVMEMMDWIPWHAPQGNYTKRYLAWTPEGEHIFCVNATVWISGDP